MSPGVAEKLRRADMHRDDLERRIDRFIGTEPYRVSKESDVKAGKRRWVVNIDRSPPAIRWGALLGESLFGYRSALDNLAYDLAVSYSGTLGKDVARTSAFPIYWWRAPTKKDLDKKIGSVHPEARRLIEEMQPYGRTDRAALKHLDAIHNFDKHRALHLVGAATIGVAAYGDIDLRQMNWGGLKDGDALLETALSDPDQDPHFIFGIALSEEGPGTGVPDVRWLLKWISDHIRKGVVPLLLPYL